MRPIVAYPKTTRLLLPSLLIFGCSDSVMEARLVKATVVRAQTGAVIEVNQADSETLANTSITIPALALSEETEITVSEGTDDIVEDGSTVAGPPVVLGPDGLVFKIDVVLSIPFVLPFDPELARVFRREGHGTETVLTPDLLSYNAQTRTVSFNTRGFSRFQSGLAGAACDHVDCLSGLTCDRGRCIPSGSSGSDGGTGGDGGTTTDGGPATDGGSDGGTTTDGGPITDGGTTTDGGPATDGGSDGGTTTDGGPTTDGGSDGGTTTDGGSGSDGGAGTDGGVVGGGPPTGIGVWSWAVARAPSPRFAHTAVWAGTRMLVTGGRGGGGASCAPEAMWYTPATNRWESVGREIPHSFRANASAVWADDEVILFGGGACGLASRTFGDGFRYRPWSQSTVDFDASMAPGARVGHTALWTGEEMLIWGGSGQPQCVPDRCAGVDEVGGRYHPATDVWTPISATDAPRGGGAVWTGESLLVWSGKDIEPEPGGVYTLASDSWQTIPVPEWSPPKGQPSSVAWIGEELFVWDGASGARYNPSSQLWTRTSTVGAPFGVTASSVVWTGEEVVVLGTAGGGHYHPKTDSWTPLATRDAFLPPGSSSVVWTGNEIIVFGGWPLTSQAARYGPKLTGQQHCDGGEGALTAAITSPSTRVIVGTEVSVAASVTNQFSVSRVQWFLDGQPVSVEGLTGSIELAPTFGTHNLSIEVEDVMGNVVCHDRTLFVDAPPVISLASPRPLEAVSSQVTVSATCTDDGPGGCSMRVMREGHLLYAGPRGASSVETMIDLSEHDGSKVELVVEAWDDRHQGSSRTVAVLVEASPKLVPHAIAKGQVCDVDLERILYQAADGTLVEHRLSDDSERRLPTPDDHDYGTPVCGESFLAPGGAVIRTPSWAHWSNDGATETWWALGLEHAGDRVLTVDGAGALVVRNLAQGVEETVVMAGAPPIGHAVAEDGTVAYQLSPGQELFVRVPGQAPESIGAVPDVPLPRIRGNHIIFRVKTGATESKLSLWDGATTIDLTAPNSSWIGSVVPLAGADYDARGDFVVFARPDALGARQLWLRDLAGSETIVTPEGGATDILGIGSNGHVSYRKADAIYLWSLAQGGMRIGSDAGRVLWSGADMFVVYGQDVFRVDPTR